MGKKKKVKLKKDGHEERIALITVVEPSVVTMTRFALPRFDNGNETTFRGKRDPDKVRWIVKNLNKRSCRSLHWAVHLQRHRHRRPRRPFQGTGVTRRKV